MKCPLCGNCVTNRFQLFGREYAECSVCGSYFMGRNDLPEANAERSRYLTHNNTISNQGYVRFLSSVIPFIKRFRPTAKTVLDYGCGHTPVLVELLKQAGYQVTGYDPFFFPDLPADEKFDCIVSVETFEHFFLPAIELRRIQALLKPRGSLVIKTQILQEGSHFVNWWYVKDFTHTFFYRNQTFEWIAGKWGWQLVYTDQKEHVVFQKI